MNLSFKFQIGCIFNLKSGEKRINLNDMKKYYSFFNLILITSKLILVLLVFCCGLILHSQNIKSNATLTVENNQNTKKASSVGTSYLLELTNTSLKSATFIISIINTSDENNTNLKSVGGNGLKLENEIRDKSYKVFNKDQKHTKDFGLAKNNNQDIDDLSYSIKLNKNEVFKFYVNQIVSKGAIEGSKNTSKVVVTSEDFPDLNLTKILQTEYTNCCAE